MNKKGFTLIELLVVVAIIGVLASVVLSSLSTARERAQNIAYVAEITQLQKALELYHIDHGVYPPGPRFTRISELEPYLSEYTNQLPADNTPTITRVSVAYITEYTGDQNCVPPGINIINRTNGNSAYSIRFFLSEPTAGIGYPFGPFYDHCVHSPK